MKMKSWLPLVLLSGGIASAETRKPNIIVFFVDDMGLMDTSLPFLTDRKSVV